MGQLGVRFLLGCVQVLLDQLCVKRVNHLLLLRLLD